MVRVKPTDINVLLAAKSNCLHVMWFASRQSVAVFFKRIVVSYKSTFISLREVFGRKSLPPFVRS